MNSEQPLGYRGLIVWQKAMNLAEEVYALVKLLPDSERYGMISQIHVPLFLSLATLLKGMDAAAAIFVALFMSHVVP